MIKIPKDPSREILLYWRIHKNSRGKKGISQQEADTVPRDQPFYIEKKERKKGEAKKGGGRR